MFGVKEFTKHPPISYWNYCINNRPCGRRSTENLALVLQNITGMQKQKVYQINLDVGNSGLFAGEIPSRNTSSSIPSVNTNTEPLRLRRLKSHERNAPRVEKDPTISVLSSTFLMGGGQLYANSFVSGMCFLILQFLVSVFFFISWVHHEELYKIINRNIVGGVGFGEKIIF